MRFSRLGFSARHPRRVTINPRVRRGASDEHYHADRREHAAWAYLRRWRYDHRHRKQADAQLRSRGVDRHRPPGSQAGPHRNRFGAGYRHPDHRRGARSSVVTAGDIAWAEPTVAGNVGTDALHSLLANGSKILPVLDCNADLMGVVTAHELLHAAGAKRA